MGTEAISPVIKRSRRETFIFRLAQWSRMVKLYLHFPILLHGVVHIKHRDNFTVFIDVEAERRLNLGVFAAFLFRIFGVLVSK
jgi:hypothetical protein